MISLVHAAIAVAAWLLLWQGLGRAAFVDHAPDPQIAAALALAVLIASAAGSVALIATGIAAARPVRGSLRYPVAGWLRVTPGRALLLDLVALAAVVWALGVLELGTWPRDLGGIVVAAVAISRLAPAALAVVRGAPAWLALVLAVGLYGAMAAWLPVASAPFGDQIDYLLDADRLQHGSLDATLDEGLFLRILGVPPSPLDAATHVANTPLGPRPIQGYAMPLLILPGWALAGRLGAGMIVALVAAWTSFQTLLILRDVLTDRPTVGWTWLMTTALLPISLLATHIYPNVVGAALVASAFRAGFTAPVARPALAAALLALTLFLNPRDGLALLVLVPFLAWRGTRSTFRRVAVAVGIVALVAVAANAALYGVPLPYAGYLFGTGQAQAVTHESSIVPSFWIGLPAILFDRDLGLAGSAPWIFIGLLGLAPALRRDRARLLPAALTVGAGLAVLSFFRLWEGGYAPPGRYVVDVLPLWAPFVAYGLTVAADGGARQGTAVTAAATSTATSTVASAITSVAVRIVVGFVLAVSAVTAFVLNAVPTLALNSAFDDKIRDALRHVLGLDPLGWLPSFQPLTPTWYFGAYLALVPALVVVAGLLWVGAKYDFEGTEPAAGAVSVTA